jgi:cob(I)alamin adenosyltransferase
MLFLKMLGIRVLRNYYTPARWPSMYESHNLFWHYQPSCLPESWKYNNGMSPFYTRTGDEGNTGLLGEGRVPKFDLRIEALGALDEATAALGLARASAQAQQSAALLLETQRDLYRLMAEVGATPENAATFRSIDDARVKWLEAQIDALSESVPMPREFIVPGENSSSAAMSLARTVVRRAERRVVELFHQGGLENPHLLSYLNRLSSLCFMLELLENQSAGQTTLLAKKP